MHHAPFISIVTVLIASVLAGGPFTALAAERHAGSIVSVDVEKRMLLVEELGVASRVEQLHLWIGPRTRVVRSEALPAAEVTDASYPFRDTPIELQDLRPGDFVVVELDGSGKRTAVTAVILTRPRS